MYYYFKKLVLGLIRLYALVALSGISVVLLVCLWVVVVDKGYELLHSLHPTAMLGTFIFHGWLLFAANHSLNKGASRDSRRNRSYPAVRLRVY